MRGKTHKRQQKQTGARKGKEGMKRKLRPVI